ncbi:MAG: type II secretion system GspH family protein [Nitrospirota bacterium]|nr:type II secretion system GspH family protein [Nitrospirota bacterium]
MKTQCGVRSAKCEVNDAPEHVTLRFVTCDEEKNQHHIPRPDVPHQIRRFLFRTPHSALRTSSGFTYIALLAAIVIIGISMGAAGKYWQAVMAREKEEELLFRGNQYRLAIERYTTAIPGRLEYPRNIDDLLSDGRTARGKRHLRQKYKDPITGEDFELLRDQTKGNRLIGVYSSSDKEPFKQADFPDENREFEGKTKYNEWKFVYTAPQQQPGAVLPRPAAAPAAN